MNGNLSKNHSGGDSVATYSVFKNCGSLTGSESNFVKNHSSNDSVAFIQYLKVVVY